MSVDKHRAAFLADPYRAVREAFSADCVDFASAKSWRSNSMVLLEQRTPISRQGKLGTCVLNASCDGVEMLMQEPIELSRLDGYWKSRRLHGAEERDEGTYVSSAFEMWTKVGVCPESMWPYVEENVNVRPPLEALLEGAANLMSIDSYRSILTEGKDRVRDFKLALDMGKPIVAGFAVADWWDDVGSTEKVYNPPRKEEVTGWHAVLTTGYREAPDGSISFCLRNSWGEGWGVKGYAWVDAEYIAKPSVCEDIVVPLLSPR